MTTVLLVVAAGICLYVARNLLKYGNSPKAPLHGYILENRVAHARLLPVESRHSFAYPTLALFLSLKALESKSLDLYKGWIFGYGSSALRLVGLSSKPYFLNDGGKDTILTKLRRLVQSRLQSSEGMLDDAWIMTMPAFLGFEGINPLTVYFCYNSSGSPWLVVLEIHNTFGETHVHVLEVGVNEDPTPMKGYIHQWTFPKEFHVSPFNDRAGSYRVAVRMPSTVPSNTSSDNGILPALSVYVALYGQAHGEAVDSSLGQLKFWGSTKTTRSYHLTTINLLSALARAPFALLITLPLILYNAWILHYTKRLDIYIRPEPKPARPEWNGNSKPQAGGVKWQEEKGLERYARLQVEAFLAQAAEIRRITVTLIAADLSIPPRTFPCTKDPSCEHLTISYLSSRFFTILFLSPSAEHALRLGCDTEGVFNVSSKKLFVDVFSRPEDSHSPSISTRQWLRKQPIPSALQLKIPPDHFLDQGGAGHNLASTTVLCLLLSIRLIEKWIFAIGRTRLVAGDEPWDEWKRALLEDPAKLRSRRPLIGSVRHR